LVQSYTYDSLNRLESATEMVSTTQSWKQTFSYDRFGNRNFVENQTSFPEIIEANRKLYNPTVNKDKNRFNVNQGYDYDAAGNVTKDASNQKFVYNGENKQTKVETVDANGNVIAVNGEYYYDGSGRRVKKVVGNETTIFVYNASGQMIAEYATTAPTTPKISYLTSDTLGTPRINTNTSGAVSARHDYMPFGEEIIGLGGRSSSNDYQADYIRQKFTGQLRDTESGLDYFNARYYSSFQGRFSSIDPINITNQRLADPQRINLYVYVRNNPLKFSDPSGMDLIIGEKDRSEAERAFKIIRLGLRKADRKHVKLVVGDGKNGFAKGEFGVSVSKTHQSTSGNFQSVQKIANDAKDRAEVRINGKNEDISGITYQAEKQGGNIVATPFSKFLASQGVSPTTYVLKNAEGGGQTLFPLSKTLIEGAQYTNGPNTLVLIAPDGTNADKASTLYHEFRHVSESDLGRSLPKGTHGNDPRFTNGPGTTGLDRDAENEAIKNAKIP